MSARWLQAGRLLCLAAAAAVGVSGQTAVASRAVLDQYCTGCHNQTAKTAGLMLDTLDVTRVGEHRDEWEKVARKIRSGAMPPPRLPRPDKATALEVARYLEGELDREARERPNPGRPTLHRLNRAEYGNAVRDLFGLELDVASLLPGDGAAYGFDNNADALSLSPALTERYLGAAAKISQTVLGLERGVPTADTFFVPTDRKQGSRVNEDLPWGSRGGLAVRYYFPADGEYLVQVKLNEAGIDGGIIGITKEEQQLVIAIDGAKVSTATIGGSASERQPGAPRPTQAEREERDRKILESLLFRVAVQAGEHLVQAYFVQRTTALVEDLFDPYLRRDPYRAGNGEPGVASLAITPPARSESASAASPTRDKLFVCYPHAAAEQTACAEKIIATLARRAYRRPVTDDDLAVPFARYRDGASKGSFESGLELALRSILVSPKFLFRVETQPQGVAPGEVYRINDLELASRLSFFLWSSIPDDELLEVAGAGRLHEPEALREQVRRMLADPRSEALVKDFAGQWLQIRNVAGFFPSPELLFHFDDQLREGFATETEMFFGSIIRENRSVLDLLDADYTFLNERLAKHYGIEGVYGERFRRVSLPPESPRRGLLGQGSILTGTARPNRTSPVIRGKWILENIFGAPPAPPPANVPALKEERDPNKILPMREQIAAHRANPACAGCHEQMDQLGFALENFDAIGEWREVYANNLPIDASAELPDGTTMDGPVELRKVLLGHSDDFLATVAERLLTYALGRGLEAGDMPALREITRGAAGEDYRFASLIQGVASSVPFTMAMATSETN